VLQEFAQWIENVTAWTIGVNLFVGHLPDYLPGTNQTKLPERLVLILETTPAGVDAELPDRVDKEIQFWNRAQTYFTARADAHAIYKRLHGRSWIELPVLTVGEEYVIWTADAVAEPYPIENPGPTGLFVFSTNFILRVADKNA